MTEAGSLRKMSLAWLTVLMASFATIAMAQPVDQKHFMTKGAFTDVFQDLQDAIVNRGLKIDYTGHVDTMLERTSKAAGSVTEGGDKSPYLHAKYVQFCSAKLTHQSVSASPYNLAICPYILFIFESRAQPGTVVVGFRQPQAGPSRLSKAAFVKVGKLLEAIAKEATSQ
ncbi:MAG: DUF302 domain-containing protein [Hyphomicrobiaceae bacterium]